MVNDDDDDDKDEMIIDEDDGDRLKQISAIGVALTGSGLGVAANLPGFSITQ